MRKLMAVILGGLAGLVVGSANAAQSAGPINLDFAASQTGPTPPGWNANPFGPTSKVSLTAVNQDCQTGRTCAVLTIADNGGPAAGGTLLQRIDASPLRGGGLHFRAAVRTDPSSRAQPHLWLRVDSPTSVVGSFVETPTITAQGWTVFDLTVPVAKDATAATLGLRLEGAGKVWIDSISVTPISLAELGFAPPRPLSPRGLANLEAFARLLGDVRFFHPSDQAASADWSTLAIAGVQRVEGARGAEDLAAALNAVFAPIAPTVRVFRTGTIPPTPAPALTPSPGATLIHWVHRGVGLSSPWAFSSKREPLEAKAPEILSVDLGDGVSALVPIDLYRTGHGTLPGTDLAPIRPDKPIGFNASGQDRSTRLADVVLAWTVLQQFYPYFDVVHADWPGELRKGLNAAATDPDDVAFEHSLSRMIAALKDGHGNVSHSALLVLPVAWTWIEGQLVITAARAPDADGLVVGDVITGLNGRPIETVVAEMEPLISAATPQYMQTKVAQRLSLIPNPALLQIDATHADGKAFRATLKPFIVTPQTPQVRPTPRAPIAEVKPGVIYVDLSRLTAADLSDWLDRLATAKGVVLDDRGYPTQTALQVLPHLSTHPVHSALFETPVRAEPDSRDVTFDAEFSWALPPAAPTLRGKLVMLVGGGSVSYAESVAGLFEGEHLGPIVGEATAGTNGDIVNFDLPGAYHIIFTGLRVVKRDGSRHHGVGIAPTVPVHPTLAGFRAGHDEVLERGVAIAAEP